MMENRTLDVVFEGGGARGLALNGAVSELERRGFRFGRLVGTSAGAITATLVAAGYTADALWQVGLERLPSGASRMTDFIRTPNGFTDDELRSSMLGEAMAHPHWVDLVGRNIELLGLRALLHVDLFASVFSFVERGGIYSAEGFVAWLVERLDAEGRAMSTWTLGELFARTGNDLTLIASDTTAEELIALNHRTAPDVPLVAAVRMSMSIPFLWPEVHWARAWGTYLGREMVDHAIVDGGITSNLALRFLVSEEPWIEKVMGRAPSPETQVLALRLDGRHAPPGAPAPKATRPHSRALDRIARVFETALSGNDRTEDEAYASLLCALPTQGFGTLEFEMSPEQVEVLMRGAVQKLNQWLTARGDVPHTIAQVRALRRF
ncbi:MAG: patatin-like phospholipase family protein [Deltaproteobacteria bacterium]|jgi:NTE family protein